MKASIKRFALLLFFPVLFLSLSILAAFSGSNGGSGTILLIQSYNEEYPWEISYRQEIEKNLGSKYKFEYFRMDTKRLSPEKHQERADLAWEKYRTVKPVLVFLGDDAALKYLGPRFSGTKTPVVYLGINNNPRAYIDISTTTNITGVLERPMIMANFNVIRKIYNDAKNILILFDNDLTSKVMQQETFSGKNSISDDNVTGDLRMIDGWEEWQAAVRDSAGKYDAIIAGMYHTLKDKNGVHVASDDVIRWTSANTPIPLFGLWEINVGYDRAIGGLVLSGKEQGKAASEIALKILSGVSPSSIYPVTAEKGRFLFSRKQLEKYGIKLPPELEIRADLID